MSHEPRDIELPYRPIDLAGILFTGILAGALVGAATNAVNGLVSPTYFIRIMCWQHVENVWRASVAQGIFEGCVFGFVFSLIFTITAGIITGTSAAYWFAFKHLCGIVGAALGCWGLLGLRSDGTGGTQPRFLPWGIHRRSGGIRRNARLRVGGRFDLGRAIRRLRLFGSWPFLPACKLATSYQPQELN